MTEPVATVGSGGAGTGRPGTAVAPPTGPPCAYSGPRARLEPGVSTCGVPCGPRSAYRAPAPLGTPSNASSAAWVRRSPRSERLEEPLEVGTNRTGAGKKVRTDGGRKDP